jgi:hypothetical protein
MIIVNFATREFRRGQMRLADTVTGHADVILYNDYF